MELLILCVASFLASALTLFSGFGLGTLLMPVVALFFPLELAIAMTAMVHLANNLFKIGLLGKKADRTVVVKFGLPAIAAAFVGAVLLLYLGEAEPIYEYEALGSNQQVSIIKLVIGTLIVLFVVLELSPTFSRTALDRNWLPLGGVISGFFGGLSGHQGAFRSMFLLKAGLEKEAFVATGVVLAVMVDIARMVIYGADISTQSDVIEWTSVIGGSLSAFTGAYVGAKMLKKVTFRSIQLIVSALLMLVGFGLIAGVL
jgi:uncharacterized protein